MVEFEVRLEVMENNQDEMIKTIELLTSSQDKMVSMVQEMYNIMKSSTNAYGSLFSFDGKKIDAPKLTENDGSMGVVRDNLRLTNLG